MSTMQAKYNNLLPHDVKKQWLSRLKTLLQVPQLHDKHGYNGLDFVAVR
jgi:hypothetical protein